MLRILTKAAKPLALVSAGLIVGAGTPATTLADQEWEENTRYYEDDAWYDVSEWLDGNDYNPTDEEFGEWDDEVYQFDNDWDTDNDTNYGYYDNVDSDSWYYDYYDDNYVYGDNNESDAVYDYAYDYYDYDNDGFYDAYASYYDWNSDGQYEDYNFYVFVDDKNSNSQQQSAQKDAQQRAKQQASEKSSKQYQLTGTIEKTKKVKVRSGENMVLQVKADQRSFLVDLGSAEKASNWNLAQGDEITVRGPVTQVGEKQVLLARSIQPEGKDQQAIDRSQMKLQGTIKSLKTAKVRGNEHQLAVVDSKQKDKKVLIDLGRKDRLSTEFSEGDQITVHGVPVRVKDKPAVLANKVEYQGETIKIDRLKNKPGSQQTAQK